MGGELGLASSLRESEATIMNPGRAVAVALAAQRATVKGPTDQGSWIEAWAENVGGVWQVFGHDANWRKVQLTANGLKTEREAKAQAREFERKWKQEGRKVSTR